LKGEYAVLKRTLIFIFILSALALLAMAPMSVSPVSENALKRQETVTPTAVEPTAVEPTLAEPTLVEPTVEATVEAGLTLVAETPSATPGVVPVTGNNDPSANSLTYVLLAIIGIAVIVGGIALMNRRQI
jgi:hypothetical protein